MIYILLRNEGNLKKKIAEFKIHKKLLSRTNTIRILIMYNVTVACSYINNNDTMYKLLKHSILRRSFLLRRSAVIMLFVTR